MTKANFADYSNGAITALSYIAQSGAPLQSVLDTMQTMVLMLDANTDEGDKERFIEAFGADTLKSAGVLE
ncbi:hypothetical protein V6259_12705 [Marinomonas sp. TI.3.20]|uniref:hypothetical protein n=1 Tax=Marinomonas sp. TI.3.20 TaxID=3121296 RepID=UPI00311EB135